MKTRNGFVSNSSSSSFVCMISGEAFEVQDGQLCEAGLCRCSAEHIFKEEFLVPWTPEFPSKEEMLAKLEEGIDSKRECQILRNSGLQEIKRKYASAVFGDGEYEVNVNACPICTMTNIPDGDLVKFMLKQAKVTRAELVKTIKKDFGNYETFERFLSTK